MPLGYLKFAELWNSGVHQGDPQRISTVYFPEGTKKPLLIIAPEPVALADFVITSQQVGLAITNSQPTSPPSAQPNPQYNSQRFDERPMREHRTVLTDKKCYTDHKTPYEKYHYTGDSTENLNRNLRKVWVAWCSVLMRLVDVVVFSTLSLCVPLPTPLSSPRMDKTLIWSTISPRSCPIPLPRYLPLPPALLDCPPFTQLFQKMLLTGDAPLRLCASKQDTMNTGVWGLKQP